MMLVIVNLVSHLAYLGVFLGTFIEGPTVGLLVGFLSRAGFLNLFWVYVVYVLADLSADIFYYFIGYQGRRTFFKKIRISEKNLIKAQEIKKIFHRHPKKIIILGKLTHVIGLPVLITVGTSHYDWRKFLFFDFLATLLKSAILISLGYYLAEFWIKADNIISYLGIFGLLFVVITIIILGIKKIIENL